MRVAVLAALAATLAGCAASPVTLAPETVPAVLAAPVPVEAPVSPGAPAARRPCPPIDPAVAAESQHLTPIAGSGAGGTDAMTAALMNSEAAKNARLRQVLLAYERCRSGRK